MRPRHAALARELPPLALNRPSAGSVTVKRWPWMSADTHDAIQMLVDAGEPEMARELENFCHCQAREQERWDEHVETGYDLERLGDLHARRLDARRGNHEFSDDGVAGKPRKAICGYSSPGGPPNFHRKVASAAIDVLLLDRAAARAQGREQWAKWLIGRAVIEKHRHRKEIDALLTTARDIGVGLPPGRPLKLAAVARGAGVSATNAERWLIKELVPRVVDAIAEGFLDLLEMTDPLELERLPDDFLEPEPWPPVSVLADGRRSRAMG